MSITKTKYYNIIDGQSDSGMVRKKEGVLSCGFTHVSLKQTLHVN